MTASHSAAGTVRKNTSRSVADSVVLSRGMSFATAARDNAGRLTVASATPNTPIGSCMMRNAYHSHDTLPCWSRLAIWVLTSRLSWVAASPIVAGTMSVATRRTPGCQVGRSKRSRKPSDARAGSWKPNWSSPPSSTPIAMARIAGWPSAVQAGISATPNTIMPRLSMVGASAGTANRPRALSIPIAAAASATTGRNGSMTRVSRTVSSILPGTLANPAAKARTSHGVVSQPTTHSASSTTSSVDMSWRPRAHASASPRRSRTSVKVGTNADDIAPSANRSRSRLGMRNATLNASVASPAPNRIAMTCSRASPSTRESRVAAPTTPAWRATRSSSPGSGTTPGALAFVTGPPPC